MRDGDWTSTTARGNEPRAASVYERFAKPALDRVFGLLFAVITLPALLVLWGLVRIFIGSPAISRTAHVGKNGTRFNLYKLRTNHDHTTDLRGRRRRFSSFLREWSLDELPQFWNVALGHMSMVGPRPIPPDVASELTDWELRRHEVKPGLTGLWQAEARGDGRRLSDNIHYDIQYIDQLSWVTDLRILAKTVGAFLTRREGQPDSRAPRTRVRDRFPHIRLITTDLALWAVALPFAVWVRFDFDWPSLTASRLTTSIVFAMLLQFAWGWFAGIYRGRWRLASFEETAWVGAGSALVTGLLLVGATFLGIPLVARGAIAGAGAFHIIGALAARYLARIAYTKQRRSTHQRNRRLLVYGAGEAGLGAVKALWMDRSSDLEPVAFLDDDRTKHGSRLLGLPVVGGRASLPSTADRYDVDSLLVAMPSAGRSVIDDLAAVGRDIGLNVQMMPPLVASLSDLLVQHARQAPTERRRLTASRTAPVGTTFSVETGRDFDLAVIGLGYVGLPVAVHASQLGLRVVGVDVDGERTSNLMEGTSYIEDVSADSLANALDAGFVATTDSSMLARADAITISVPTPLREGLPDLSAVISAAEAVGDQLQQGQVVILESTTYPGTTEEVVQPILERRSGLLAGTDFFLAYSPERIDPGNQEWGIDNTPKLVGGINEESTERAALLYQKFSPVVTMSGTQEAEMAKLLENTYRHVNIALVNELAIFCRQLGVDIWETIRGAATKPFGFEAFYPGPGVGGHCIPIDPNYLSYRVRELGDQFRFIELAGEINHYMPVYTAGRALEMLEKAGKQAQGSVVLLVGVTYKPDVADMRETTAVGLAEALADAGAFVEFFDPYVDQFAISGHLLRKREELAAALRDADLVIIHTAHSQLDIEEISDSSKLLLDTRGVTTHPLAERL